MAATRRRAIPWIVAAWLCAGAALAPAPAAVIVGAKAGSDPALSPDKKYLASLVPRPVGALEKATDDELKLLAKVFPKWTFAAAAAAAPGTFNILQYSAYAAATTAGANFSVLYDDAKAEARTDLSWIQVAYPTAWGAFGNDPFVDSAFNNFPFYANYTPISLPNLLTPATFPAGTGSVWLNQGGKYPQQRIQNPTGGGDVPAGDLIFVDTPSIPYSLLGPGGTSSIGFHLYLASFTWNGMGGADAGGAVTLYDGMGWGVRVATTPEPPGWALLGVGALALLAASRRGARAARSLRPIGRGESSARRCRSRGRPPVPTLGSSHLGSSAKASILSVTPTT